MGEVATGVLHNVGNALNGVNTSVALAITAVDRADFSRDRVAVPLEGDVSAEKQHKVAQYLNRLDRTTKDRRSHLPEELARIRQVGGPILQVVNACPSPSTPQRMARLVVE